MEPGNIPNWNFLQIRYGPLDPLDKKLSQWTMKLPQILFNHVSLQRLLSLPASKIFVFLVENWKDMQALVHSARVYPHKDELWHERHAWPLEPKALHQKESFR